MFLLYQCDRLTIADAQCHFNRSENIVYINITFYKQKPGPSQLSRLWPGLGFEKAEAASGQAKAGAFRPSRAGTALFICTVWGHKFKL
jgi:hypothetical protein